MAGSEVSDFDFKTSKKDSSNRRKSLKKTIFFSLEESGNQLLTAKDVEVLSFSPQACLHLGISVSRTDHGSVCEGEGGCCGTLATCQSCVKRLLGRLVGNTDGRRDDQN